MRKEYVRIFCELDREDEFDISFVAPIDIPYSDDDKDNEKPCKEFCLKELSKFNIKEKDIYSFGLSAYGEVMWVWENL